MQRIGRLIILTLVTTSALAQQPMSSGNPSGEASQAAASASSSPFLLAISRAREMVAGNPKDAGAYTMLGAALCHRADETGDAALYRDADDALNKTLQISPNNFEALKAHVCIELGRHEFARARE